MSHQIRQFEPSSVWSNKDGTPTPRALGWMRSISDFIGATFGSIPPGSLTGAGAATDTFLRNDGVYAIPQYPVGADPTGSVGPTATNGVATTFMRSDAAPALDLTVAYTFTNNITAASLVAVGGFGCNGKTAQTAATVNAAVAGTAGAAYTATEQGMLNDMKALVNQIRTALVNNGVAV
jgi:hypothetical protein